MSDTMLLNKLYAANELDELSGDAGVSAAPRPPGASYYTELIRSVYGKQNGMGTAVLFTGLDRGCGVSYLCSSIAAELGGRGGKVLLADAEAIAALAGTQRPGTFCARVGSGKVWVLGGKQVRKEDLPAAPVSSSAAGVLKLLRAEFSFLVIDAPALAENDVALSLAAAVEGVVFVAEAGRTEKRKLAQAQRSFTSLGGRVFGSIYNER